MRDFASRAEAKAVRVSLGGIECGGFELTKGKEGVWTGITQKPLDEGFHYYHLTVDGGTFNDPGTLNFYGSTRWESGIEVPATTRTSTPSRMCLTAASNRFFFLRRVQPLSGGLSSTRRQDTTRTRPSGFPCCTSSMVGARMKRPGATKATPT